MAFDFIKFLTPAAIAANWTEAYSNQMPYLGSALFPNKKKAGLDLAWFKGNKGLPVSLMPSAFDAKATFRSRIGFDKLETEMPFFREGFKIKEKDRQELLRVADAHDPYAKMMVQQVFNDAAELIEGARVVSERMRMDLLFNGSIAIKANGVNYSYNYDQGGTWASNNNIDAAVAWATSATADPIADIEAVKNAARAVDGTELTRVIMNGVTFANMCKAKAIADRFLTVNGKAVGYITANDVKTVVKATTGVTVIVYDKMYKDEAGTAHKYVPDNKVAFLPNGAVGATWYGTTPEEADLRGSGKADVAIVDTGIALTRIVDEHPVNINTFASEIVLPSFEGMDQVYVLDTNP